MKKNIPLLCLFLICNHFLQAQKIKTVKETIITVNPTDSMNYMDYQKIAQFKDSGVVVLSYADSVVDGISSGRRAVVTAFDKNLDASWVVKFEFDHSYSTLSICTDKDYNVYATYFIKNDFYLAKISSSGQVVFNKTIGYNISTIPIINKITIYNGYLAVYGNCYYTQTSFAPFISLFTLDGTFKKKRILSASTSANAGALYNTSLLTVTGDNTLAFTFQKDASNTYGIACYDSTLTEVWSKSFNRIVGFTRNLGIQGSSVVFVTADDNTSEITSYKYDSKTGAGGLDFDNLSCTFKSEFLMKLMPLYNGKFLAFGNYGTTSGFDNAVEYFDVNGVITSTGTQVSGSRNRVSDACVIGNYIYTVATRFADKYCDEPNYIWRGNLRIVKFSTNFLNLSTPKQFKQASQLHFYPNPFNNEISIANLTQNEFAKVEIVNELGQSFQTTNTWIGNELQINTQDLASGIYVIRVIDKQGNVASNYKLIKE